MTGRVADFVVEAQVLGQRQYILQPVHDQVESECIGIQFRLDMGQ